MNKVALLLSLSLVGCGMSFRPSAGEVDDVRLDGRPSTSELVPVRDAGGDPNGACELIGASASDPRTGTRFTVRTRFEAPCAEVNDSSRAVRQLFAQVKGANGPRLVKDLDRVVAPRILFVRDRVLLLTRSDQRQILTFFAAHSLVETARYETSAAFGGARVSPSGRFVLFADESRFDWAALGWPLHLLDTVTGESRIIEPDSGFVDARWLEGCDRLLAVRQSHRYSRLADTRVLLWSLEEGATHPWPEPRLAIDVSAASTELWFTFAWIAISPDDRRAVVPLQSSAAAGWGHRLLVVDLETGETETIDDAYGPAEFTPDGEGLLAFRETEAGWSLLRIDGTTLEAVELPLSHQPRRSFESPFEWASASTVVISAWRASMLYDLDAGLISPMEGALARLGN